MTTHALWKLPERVDLGDITVRDGLQTLEHFVPTNLKVKLAEDLVLAGYKHIEVSNFGNPKFLPQFRDIEELIDRLLDSERIGHLLKQNGGDVTITAISINEQAVDRALEYKTKRGRGPDVLLQMVSTDPHHHKVNSGTTLDAYFEMSERCIAKSKAAGMEMCGTVSTIWGSPMKGHESTTLDKAVEFSKRYLDIGAAYIEQADHDGSADPARVYEYFSMILDPGRMGQWADPKYHLAHFHTSRGMGLANYLAALQAGIYRFETTLSGVGGQPSNTMDGVPSGGTGSYYHQSHLASGLVQTEDFVIMCEAMGVTTGIDIPRLLAVGRLFRDEGLRINAADRRALVANVSRVTGIPEDRVQRLRDSTDELDGMIVEAAEHYAQQKAIPVEKARTVMHGLLHSVQFYLEGGMWGFCRAETLVNGVPPSPYLQHLLEMRR
jgi:hydroxymethylglutaryl-CoA lyase